MTETTIIALFRGAIMQVLMLSAPILIIGAVVGLILSIFQATTSIQDQTLTFVPKILAIFLALAFFFPWMLQSLRTYTVSLFSMLSMLT
ncbi:flagellar biosynthesis protein FliQ [Entomospira nematocerorum]|uniref:Flagellar biosynthetic protein FliQ n=2 Tax=Entomospira TaxID=2834378 RepID=A0A968GC06_9SPIO|nr:MULTISPECIES: flagellar biosynthesis protein FliQ [Entomospira]NIZ40492.1 flagellar biosynthesis protein FliQ [Entomospira entomophilus]NIZ47009.1 flagellar biosynthesis protein FliQ [Entomospira nematocera]WDI34446.1 flagellar biosynthesis protein FliQ [Entomospira nematocera]WDI36050.1 flagellar biosynthesis protein FliQ [Entomospira entomophilus]